MTITRLTFTLSDMIASLAYGYALLRQKKAHDPAHYQYLLVNLNNSQYATEVINGAELYFALDKKTLTTIKDGTHQQIWINNEGTGKLR